MTWPSLRVAKIFLRIAQVLAVLNLFIAESKFSVGHE
jgi:hypothetical protein